MMRSNVIVTDVILNFHALLVVEEIIGTLDRFTIMKNDDFKSSFSFKLGIRYASRRNIFQIYIFYVASLSFKVIDF